MGILPGKIKKSGQFPFGCPNNTNKQHTLERTADYDKVFSAKIYANTVAEPQNFQRNPDKVFLERFP